jgi:hypothetical protein
MFDDFKEGIMPIINKCLDNEIQDKNFRLISVYRFLNLESINFVHANETQIPIAGDITKPLPFSNIWTAVQLVKSSFF